MTSSTCILISLLFMTGLSSSLHTGQEFITAFLQNADSSLPDAKFQIIITAFSNFTSVTVSVNDRNLSWSLHLNDKDSHTIHLPPDVEMIGSGTFNSSILISSTHDISVLAMSSKTNSTARILVLPVHQLDNQYYIIAPNEENSQIVKQFAVINYDLPSNIQIFPKGWTIMNGGNYSSSNPLTMELSPYQIYQFQSHEEISGTRVLSSNIVAVLSGHTCSWKNDHCGHIYEQHFPLTGWGKQYYVSPFPLQYGTDIVYVMASQDTKVKYISNIQNGSLELHEGQLSKFFIRYHSPLMLSANVSIQVMFYCTGGTAEKIPFDPFFISVPDISKFCTKFQVYGLQGFINAILITAKTSSIAGIKFNRLSLGGIRWKSIPGTEYSWAQYRYGRQWKSHIISHPSSVFTVMSVGISPQNSYGLSGICFKEADSCANTQCRKKESCHMVKEKPTCIPDAEAICQIWGDPHYKTFDGFTYDFRGTCSYILAKTCMGLRPGGDPTLPEFSIEAKHFNHGSYQSSYVDMVTVHIHGYNITMVHSEVGFVRVNNERWSLPILLDDGRIHITTSGFHALLETSFIRIRYDWNVFLFIKIPSSFYENVCGLCGNYNGIRDDDWETIEGVPITDMVELGRNWKVKDEYSTCWDDCNGKCMAILPGDGRQFIYTNGCGIMSQIFGPFFRCQKVVPPEMFVKNCISDMVRNNGYRKTLCDAVSVYLVVCHVQGIHVGEWRSKVGCEIVCPENSHYSPCGNPCPETCAGQPSSCDMQCMETCECNPGFVFSEGVCIPKTDCGHFCNGRYYPKGKEFWGDNGCQQRCTCDPDSSKVNCRYTECQHGEECAVKRGIRDCYPVNYSQCIAFGDLHYVTFDKMWFTLHSSCTYLLSQLCNKSLGLTEFSIEISNKKRGVHDVSFARSVLVRVYGAEILLNKKDPGKAMVNGVLNNLPINLYMDKIQVFVKSRNGVILTEFGMEVTFDWHSRISVTLPGSYAGAVCGLCGNFNGIIDDELKSKDGEVNNDIVAFGKSWRIMDSRQECIEHIPLPCGQLLGKIQRILLSNCGIMLNVKGPFRDCHSLVNPESFFENCIHDFCYQFARQDVFCKVIEAYAIACQEANGIVYEWRDNNFCRPWCPENSNYMLCSYDYPKTCSHLNLPSRGVDYCRENCDCEDGYLLEGDHCVHRAECGCVHDGIYYKVNEVFYPTPNCDKQCICQYGGLIRCSPFACGPHEVCKIKDGIKKCHAMDVALCSVLGGSYYYTFDRGIYHFQGNCSYVLTKTCFRNRNLLVNFSVVMSTSAPSKVGIFVNDVRIIMTEGKNGTVQVNDASFNLPLHLQDSDIWIWQHGINLLLTTKFGLEVIYDLSLQTIIKISSSYYGKVCGLCGNYNGDDEDDMTNQDGRQVIDETAFGEVWKDKRLGMTCEYHCLGDICLPCEERSLYEGEHFCGLLNAEEGLFSSCHDLIDPTGYFDQCVTNLCREQGNPRVLCNSLQNYVAMCQNVGITNITWRSETLCRLDCPGHSHYEVNTDACRTTCSRIDAPESCTGTHSEGCQCDNGFFLDVNQCVPFGRCGCVVEGKYYTINENFLGDHCLQLCTCHLGGAITCMAHQCPEDTTCKRVLDRTFICVK
ncbi:IgGFc-binding protein-like [Engystomops pustulosus]|uniref:IgGFc-binding protein-like n=1 Tax=Engystomops pustulosus TaxID=76066 RepID=UPI003AFB1009